MGHRLARRRRRAGHRLPLLVEQTCAESGERQHTVAVTYVQRWCVGGWFGVCCVAASSLCVCPVGRWEALLFFSPASCAFFCISNSFLRAAFMYLVREEAGGEEERGERRER